MYELNEVRFRLMYSLHNSNVSIRMVVGLYQTSRQKLLNYLIHEISSDLEVRARKRDNYHY